MKGVVNNCRQLRTLWCRNKNKTENPSKDALQKAENFEKLQNNQTDLGDQTDQTDQTNVLTRSIQLIHYLDFRPNWPPCPLFL